MEMDVKDIKNISPVVLIPDKVDAYIGGGDEVINKKEEFMKQFNLEKVRAEMDKIKKNKQNFE